MRKSKRISRLVIKDAAFDGALRAAFRQQSREESLSREETLCTSG